MFWVYADFSQSSQDLLQASPWLFTVSASNTISVEDLTGSVIMTSWTETGTGWHHVGVSMQPSPLNMQVTWDGVLIPLTTLPTVFRRLTDLYLGNSGTSNRVNGYISDLFILNTALRASLMSRLHHSLVESDTLVSIVIGASYLLTEGSGTSIRGHIDSSDLYVSLPGLIWASAPSVPPVCNPLSQFFDGSTCSSVTSNCLFGLSPGCLACDSGEVVSSDLSSCVVVCGAAEFQVKGRCYACSWPCTSCSEAECFTCATGSPVAGVCAESSLLTFYITPLNEFVPLSLLSSISSSALTIELWVLFHTFPLATNAIVLAIDDLTLEITAVSTLEVKQGLTVYCTFPALATWQHVAVVLDPSNVTVNARLRVHLNGEIQTLTGYTGQTFAYTFVSIGSAGTIYYGIREVRIWSEARTVNQIVYNYAYFLPTSLSSLPAGLMLAVPFANGDYQDLVSSKDFSQTGMFGFVSEVHTRHWPIADLGSYLCDYATATGPGTGSCIACHYLCDQAKHCLGSAADQCEDCALGNRNVGGTCQGLPVFTTSPGVCVGTVQTSLAALSVWTLDFWVRLSDRIVGNAQVLEVAAGADSFAVQLPTALGSDLRFTTLIATVSQFSTTSISAGVWTHIALQSFASGTASRARGLLNATPFHSTKTGLSLEQITLGGSISFSGYIRNLRIWDYWLEAPLVLAYSKIYGVALSGRVAEWDFSTASSLLSAETFTSTSDCFAQIPENEAPLACSTALNFPTLDTVTGLLSCTSACSSNCYVCTSASICVACSSGYFLSSAACSLQSNLVLDNSVALTWPVPSAAWTEPALTVMVWIKAFSGDGTAVLKLSDTTSWLGIAVTAVYAYEVVYGASVLATCAGAADTWQHITFILAGNAGVFSLTYYCLFTLQGFYPVTAVPTTAFTSVVLADSSMTSTRSAKMLKIYSRALSADAINAYSQLWGGDASELVLSAPLEGGAGVLVEEVSGSSISLPGTAFVTATYSVGICASGEMYLEARPMCLPCETAHCLLCGPILSICVLCDIGYFQMAGDCSSCDTNCYTCSGTSLTCSGCIPNASLNLSNSCQCDSGYFQPAGALFTCSGCDSTCQTCSNSTPFDCLSCLSPRILVANRCLLNGVFPTSTEVASFTALCLASAVPISPVPEACRVFLGPYCCPSTPLLPHCVALVPAFQCRPCTFEDTSLCNSVETACWNPDSTLKPSNDVCLTGIYQYCCLPHAPSYDCSVFNHQFACVLLGPPQLLTAIWNSGLQSLNVTFSMAIAPSSSSCADYFNPETLAALGTGSACSLNEAGSGLWVGLGSAASVSRKVTFLPNRITSALKYAANGPFGNYVDVSLTVPSTINPNPEARLSAPGAISACSDLRLEGWNSLGSWGRPLSYRWHLSSSLANAPLDAFVSQYATYSSSFGSFTIPAEKLRANSDISVTLEVMNAFGYSNQTTSLVRILQGTMPEVQFAGGSAFTIRAQEYYEFPLIITPSQCGNESNYEVKWAYGGSNCTNPAFNFTQLEAKQTNPTTLALPPHTLPASCQYFFQATVLPSSTAKLTLSVQPQLLQAFILGGDTKLSLDQAYTLDASRSSDPDYSDPPLQYTWKRCVGSFNCSFVGTNSKYVIERGTLSAGVRYEYWVEVRNGERTSKASRYIITTNETYTPSIFLLPLENPVNPALAHTLTAQVQSSAPATLHWRAVGPAVVTFTSPIDRSSVSIAPFTLLPGRSYQFQLLATVNYQTFTAEMTLNVNSPPTNGWLIVTPTQGIELQTSFRLEAQAWVDAEGNLPLSYQFCRVEEETLAIGTKSFALSLSTTLAGNARNLTRMRVRVYDSYDAYSEAERYVTVQPAYTQQAQKSAQALTLTTFLLVSNSSLSSIPAFISAISASVFSNLSTETSDAGQTSEQQVYSGLLALVQTWWTAQPRQERSVGVLADALAAMTSAPVLLTNQTITRTLALMESLLSYPLDLSTAASAFTVLSNLDSSTSIDSSRQQTELAPTQAWIRDSLITIGKATVAAAVPDQGPVLLDSSNFKGLFRRVSKEKLEGLELAVNSAQGELDKVGVSIPKGILTNVDLGGSAGVDVLMVLSRNKGGRGGFANETIVKNMTGNYIAPSQTVKLQLETSSRVNAYGELSNSQSTTLHISNLVNPLLLTIPFLSNSTTPNTSCQFYNASLSTWSTAGCVLLSLSAGAAQCACSHLTEFALADVEDGAIEALGAVNAEEAVNFAALGDLNMTTNAVGLYIAIALLVIYVVLGGLFIFLDKRARTRLQVLYSSPVKNMEDVIAHSPELYDIFAAKNRPPGPFSVPATPSESHLDDENSLDFEELSESSRLYLSHYGFDLTNTSPPQPIVSDFKHVQRAAEVEATVYEDRVMRKGRTCWEMIVANHVVLGLIFWVNSTYTRFARLTVLVCALFGHLFISGLFYDGGTARTKEEPLGLQTVVNKYSWNDFFIALISALLVIPALLVISYLLKSKRQDDSMSPSEKAKVARRNRLQSAGGYLLAWLWMLGCSIEVTLFAIQFNVSASQVNASQLWAVTFSVSTLWDLLVTQFVKVLAKIAIARFCFSFI